MPPLKEDDLQPLDRSPEQIVELVDASRDQRHLDIVWRPGEFYQKRPAIRREHIDFEGAASLRYRPEVNIFWLMGCAI
jgi:hypothetical protein